ncbi:MAG: TMEM165/GDT1 family protein [Candidatus Binatia bacterium]
MDLRFFLTVFSTVFLAELGDKTQLATFLYAADTEHSKVTVFLGAASALVVTSAIGVAMGGVVAHYVSPRVLSWLAGAGFIAIGALTIARA